MLEDFKAFVKKNPGMIKYVNSGEMSWQKFYELYDLYGEEDEAWKPYLKEEEKVAASLGFSDILAWLKQADLTKVEESINSVQRVIGVLQDLGSSSDGSTSSNYKPRPIYKHFED